MAGRVRVATEAKKNIENSARWHETVAETNALAYSIGEWLDVNTNCFCKHLHTHLHDVESKSRTSLEFNWHSFFLSGRNAGSVAQAAFNVPVFALHVPPFEN